tara:strand:- start:479 stop:727 length:249 start_codon:yes stop_codon:yes gene_type:complete
MSKLLTQSQLQSLREEVQSFIDGWLNDHEVVENVRDYRNDVSKVYETVAEMIDRWDEYAKEYRDETEVDDRADYLYESEVGK